MTDYYCGPGGNDGNSGLDWANRKLTLNGCEDIPVAAGDQVFVGPGVYREQLTVDVSGGNVYNAGTVTVTNGSTTVTGAGTAFLANVAVADMFHVRYFANGNDGVANGTAIFTSAAGNFQASMIGKVIQIMTRGAYVIGAVAAANSITLTDPNGLGWPAAAANLVYSVMSGEDHYEIDSVTDNNNFELVRPWTGPTLTGLAYIAFTPIRYIADVTGENTDGVGGVVRVTGSDNDQVTARNCIIVAGTRDYRLFRGFSFDSCALYGIYADAGCDHWVIEDCSIQGVSSFSFRLDDDSICATIRRCFFLGVGGTSSHIYCRNAVAHNDAGHVIENCCFHDRGIRLEAVGGLTERNCVHVGQIAAVAITVALAVGQTLCINNSIFFGVNSALIALVAGEITEDHNNFYCNNTDRVNVAVGANSTSYPPLFVLPLLDAGFCLPWWFGELSEWSQVRTITGAFEAYDDLRGFVRPVTAAKKSWGALQFTDMERDTGTVYAGAASMELLDAGRIQIKTPTTDRRYTIRVWVYREANYAGTNPQLIIKQPGQADRTTTDAGAAGAWNLLEDSFVPSALPPYLFVELVSNNTAAAGNYATYFDRLTVRGSPLDTGEMEQWLWDRQPMENYGKVTPVVKKDVEGNIYSEINTRGDLVRIAP